VLGAASPAVAVRAAKPRFSLATLPKPLRHLLAGAFSGGARRTRTHLNARMPNAAENIGRSRARAQASPKPPPRRWKPCA
jgi:hypothetical protein